MANRIKDIRLSKGWTLEQLADAVGSDKSQIGRLEKGQRRLTVDWMERIAKALEIDPRDLIQGVGPDDPRIEQTAASDLRDLHRNHDERVLKLHRRAETLRLLVTYLQNLVPISEWAADVYQFYHSILGSHGDDLESVREHYLDRFILMAEEARRIEGVYAPPGPEATSRADMIPIRSAGRGGEDQEMFLDDGFIGETVRPPSLRGVKGAYAIYMVGDSMLERYKSGWLLHVNPFKPLGPGRDAVVYKKNNSVLIKEYISRDSKVLRLRQLNPSETIIVPNSEISAVHLIVGSDQEGG